MAELKYSASLCGKADEILSNGKSLAAVCRALNISRQTLYDWKVKHPEFNETISKGLQKSQCYWEDIGENGIRGEIKNFSGTSWMFVMKNRFRDDYKEEKSEKGLSESLVEKFIDKLVD